MTHEVVVGPGTPLKCVKAGTCFCGCTSVTKDALYFCEEVAPPHIIDHLMHLMHCEGCSCITIFVKAKDHGLCADLFIPLNDGETSLVEEEEEDEEDFITLAEFAKRFINV